MAYAASKELRLGVLQEKNTQSDTENTWAVAAEYFHDKNCWMKGRLTNLGVLSLFSRYVINPTWTLETFLQTGLNNRHRIVGLGGTNLAAGLKLVYNE